MTTDIRWDMVDCCTDTAPRRTSFFESLPRLGDWMTSRSRTQMDDVILTNASSPGENTTTFLGCRPFTASNKKNKNASHHE